LKYSIGQADLENWISGSYPQDHLLILYFTYQLCP